MRYTRFSALSYAIPVSILALGAMLLIPGEDAPQRAASINEVAPRSTPSYLAASPELVAELDASLAPVEVDASVLARETQLPDPSAMQTDAPTASGPTTAALGATTGDEVPPSEATADSQAALRVGDVAVNMRAGPSTSTAVIRPLRPGEPLVYGEAEGGWVSVTTAAGESGWVYGSYLAGPALSGAEDAPETIRNATETAEREPPRSEDGRFARVGSDVYLRAGPSNSTDRLFVLPAGERVQIAETRGRWARVILPSGASGWVRVK
jgi:uncharacterized protein YraI